jgi:MFS family permease
VIDESQSLEHNGCMTTQTAHGTAEKATSLSRYPAFLSLWAGETVSEFGATLSGLAIPVLAITLLGATEWQVGVLNAAQQAAFLVIGLPVGAWVDRMRKRRVMIAADLVRAAALALVPVLWMLGTLQIWHVYLIAVVVGAATVFFDVGYQSFVPVLVRSDQIGSANARLQATAQISQVAGPAAAGGLLALLTAPFVLACTAAGYLVSFFCLLFVPDREQKPERLPGRSLWREIGEGLGFIWGQRLIWRITMATAAANFTTAITTTLLSVLVLRSLGLTPAVYGVLMSCASVGGILGALATPWLTRRIGEGTIIPVAAVLGSVAGLFIPLAAVLPGAAIPLLVIGEFAGTFAALVYNIAQVSFRQRVCPPPLLGRMNASIRCIVWGVMPLGALLAGALGALIGIPATMWIGGVLGLAYCTIVVFSPLRGMRTLPSGLDAHADDEPFDAKALRTSE